MIPTPILKNLLNLLTAGGAAAHQRFEKPAPNLLWQMDFKGWISLADGSRCHPLTIVDDHSRYGLCLEACGNEQGSTVQGRLQLTFRPTDCRRPSSSTMEARGEIRPDSAGPVYACGCSSSASQFCTAGPTARRAAARTSASIARSTPKCWR